MQGIYTITSKKCGRKYIGSAKSFKSRWGSHILMLNANTHTNPHLQRSWLKYGADNFVFEILEVLPTPYNKKFYFERENFHIDGARARKELIFNIARAEGGWGEKTDEEKNHIKRKISASVKAAITPETLEKMSAAKRNIPRTIEEKAKISAALSDIKKSTITREKMSAAQKKRAEVDPSLSRNMASVGRLNKGKTPVNAVKFLVDDVLFPSGKAAERGLGITSRQLAALVANGKAQRV